MLRLAKLGTVLIICSTCLLAYPGKPFRLQELVEEAELIAVVDISKIDNMGSTSIEIGGKEIAANLDKAAVTVEQPLKGRCPDSFIVNFFTPQQFVGYPGVAVGRQIIFLKRRGDVYEFADRHFPTLPVAPGSVHEVESTPLVLVIEELGRVLSSTTATQAQKWTVLARARGIPNVESFKRSLRAGLNSADDADLKNRIQAELISRDDPSQLTVSVDSLLTGSLTDQQRQRLLLVIENDVKNPKSVPAITRLLRSHDPPSRRAAAEALWHTASSDAIPDLLRILQDPDQEVRFYAVRALSDIANEPGWGGPGESEFQEHQQQYLTHWQKWGENNTR
jgi:hypothetical protein